MTTAACVPSPLLLPFPVLLSAVGLYRLGRGYDRQQQRAASSVLWPAVGDVPCPCVPQAFCEQVSRACRPKATVAVRNTHIALQPYPHCWRRIALLTTSHSLVLRAPVVQLVVRLSL